MARPRLRAPTHIARTGTTCIPGRGFRLLQPTLVEFELTDPVGKHLPGTELGDVPVAQLLSHSAGLHAETDGRPAQLDIASFGLTRTPYDPAADVPGGVDPAGWNGGR